MSPAKRQSVRPGAGPELEAVHETDGPVPRRSILDKLSRRLNGTFEVDEFGLDVELIELLDPLFEVRYRVEVRSAAVIPARGPAVVVANRRIGLSEPLVLGRGIRLATGRRVRFLGIPDIAPVGPLMRRMGGAVNRPEELRSLLQMGHVVSVPLQRNLSRLGHAGGLPAFVLEPALALGVPVIPAAVVGRERSRRWTVLLGEPIPRLRTPGPLALAELADETRLAVQGLLDEATPPHWFFG